MSEGHAAGLRPLERTVRLSRALGIPALTVFICSHENMMTRPKVRQLLALPSNSIGREPDVNLQLFLLGTCRRISTS